MNPLSLKQARGFLNFYQKQVLKFKLSPSDFWVAPPAVFLEPLIEQYKNFIFGAQNCFYEKQGAFTGEISPIMLKKLNANFVLLGHSERKKLGENLNLIHKKVVACLKAGLITLLCFGELEKPKTLNIAKIEWENQYNQLLKKIDSKLANKLILVFEPAWAISTQKQGWVERSYLESFIDWFGKRVKSRFKKINLVYGGSVNSQVVQEFSGLPLVGYLIGANSFQRQEFVKILKAYYL